MHYKQLGEHQKAAAACSRCGDFVGAAESCEEEARVQGGEKAEAKLQEAIRHYRRAKEYLKGFQLMQRHPRLAKNMNPEVSPSLLPIWSKCTVVDLSFISSLLKLAVWQYTTKEYFKGSQQLER